MGAREGAIKVSCALRKGHIDDSGAPGDDRLLSQGTLVAGTLVALYVSSNCLAGATLGLISR